MKTTNPIAYRHQISLILCAFAIADALTLPAALHAADPFPGIKADHQGVALSSVPIGQDIATVLCPEKPAPGRPWVLAPGIYPLTPGPVANAGRTQMELAKRGFHVVALALGNTYGAPAAIAKWDALYTIMTGKYGLAPKAAMMGLSREGLYIARWAAANPGKVSCLYMDKAVCDIKSWPGGKLGIGKGSLGDWNSLIQLYGFKSEAEVLAFNQNPVDLCRNSLRPKWPSFILRAKPTMPFLMLRTAHAWSSSTRSWAVRSS